MVWQTLYASERRLTAEGTVGGLLRENSSQQGYVLLGSVYRTRTEQSVGGGGSYTIGASRPADRSEHLVFVAMFHPVISPPGYLSGPTIRANASTPDGSTSSITV